MADIKFIPKARNANAVSGELFENGSMIVATDTGELYVDYNGARMRIGDVITLETEAQRLATLAPLPKLYYVTETGKLWRFADDWVCINPEEAEVATLSIAKKRFFQVAEFSSNQTVYEVLIKTRIPKINQICMPVIHVYGYMGNLIVDFNVFLYWSNNKFTYAKAINSGNYVGSLKAFTYQDNGTEYIGISFSTNMYFLHFVVDFLDMWVGTRDYNEGWTIEANTSSTTSIIPDDNLTAIPWGPISTDITGNAATATNANTAATLSNVVPITKGGTGTTSADNARTALETGYTIRRTITTTAAGWYRIAATTVNVGRNYTDVYINASLAGKNSQIGLIAAVTYGHSGTGDTAVQLSQKAFVEQYKDGVTKARIVYPNDSYANKYAYLEIYQEYNATATYSIEFQNCSGWATRYDEPVTGGIPDGYSARELTFVHNAIVADKFVGDLNGTASNAELLSGVDGKMYIRSYLGRISHDTYGTHDNFDVATQQGEYAFSGTPDELNGPIPPGFSTSNKYYGKLIVEVSDGTSYNVINNYIWQTWQNTTGFVYRRQRVNDGEWSDWVSVATGGLLYPPVNAGVNSLGTPTISEVACVTELLSDRLQFFPTTKCMAETSTDGTSWTTKNVSSAQWNSLLCCNPSYLAGLTWDNGTQLRLTFTYNTYVILSMLYLYVATGSRLKVVIERYRNSTQDWVELASKNGVVGQPQHITLWHDAVRFTNTANDSYSSKVRVTLIHEGNSTDTPRIDMLRWKGGYPAVNPYIYSWNPSKAVTFPSTITATNFIGQWNGKSAASSFDENSTTTIPTCKQIADYVKTLIGE